MKNKAALITIYLTGLVLLSACQESSKTTTISYKEGSPYPVFESTDDFEDGYADFWRFQKAADERITIVSDPAKENNKVLRVGLNPDERTHGGNRTELVIAEHDSLGYKSDYGFRFMLPESFFAEEDTNIWFMIHQWHDEPQAGYNWKTNKHKTKPPSSLIVQYIKNEGYKLVYVTGLKTGDLQEAKIAEASIDLQPDTWYEFTNEIFWSVYDSDGFSKPALNGQAFRLNNEPTPEITGRNMYNTEGSFYKFGLYSSGKQKATRHLYFDDFFMRSQRLAYAPLKGQSSH